MLPVCATCGVQFGAPAERCPVCEDPRQYVPPEGQRWTSVAELAREHRNEIRDEAGLTGIATEPRFAIGQRALLVPWGGANLLWDCITLLDDATAEEVSRRGGLRAIAISHPHYYSAMVDWAHRFECPILLHEADREWIMRPDDAIELWSGETRELGDGLTLAALEPFAYERILGAWWGTVIPRDGRAIVERSAQRYISAIQGKLP
jgi:hypothetical protein